MAIENIKYQIHTQEEKTKEILATENIEKHICAISETLFQKDLEIGQGNFSRVYRDSEAGIVYKKEKPLANPKNNVHEEAAFLVELAGLSSDVIVPLPVVSFVANIKRDKDSRSVKQSVLVMEEIRGVSIDKMLPKKPGQKPEYPFPKSFDMNTFFTKLRDFVHKMQNEKGIYHRDLYDRNIMIEESSGKPVVIDFGDAVRFNEEFAEEGEFDAYGNIIRYDNSGNKIPRKNQDIENINNLEAQVRKFLTENNKSDIL